MKVSAAATATAAAAFAKAAFFAVTVKKEFSWGIKSG